MRTETYISLYEIVPDLDVDYEHYYRCEQEVIGPALRGAGYEHRGIWFTGDGDSFGPLTRCIRTDRGLVVYG